MAKTLVSSETKKNSRKLPNMKTKNILISVILPTFKQEKTILRDINKIVSALEELRYDYELIVVVDGMADKTYEEAKKIKNKKVKVVGYETNHGKGYAVRYGMAKSKGDIIGFMDAGGDLNEKWLSMMLEHFRWYNADIIIGSKRHPVSIINYPAGRKILSWGYQILIKILFGLNIRDSQVGMKLYRREVLEKVLPRLIVKNFAFDIEILVVAYKLGYKRIFEAPVEIDFTHVTSSITSKSLWRVIYATMLDTLAIFYRLKILRYYNDDNRPKWKYDPELNFRVNLP